MATATLSYNLKTLIGDNVDPRRTRVWVSMNVPLITVGGTELRPDDLPTQTPASDGTGSFTLVTTNSATNPTSFAYVFHIDYVRRGSRERAQWHSSEFPFTVSNNIASIAAAFDGIALPANWRSEFLDELEQIRDDAVAITGISSTDSAVAALVNTVAGPLTQAALADSIAAATGTPLTYINVYDGFFGGQDSVANPSIWTNPSHLNSTGLDQWADYIIAHAGIKGTSPKVVWFGDSWVAQSPSILTASTQAVIPGANVVVSGVSGNTSTMMLARFAADVPTDADYVIFNEPGVNDVYQGYSPADVATNLEALVNAIRGIGAVPIFTGIVPLSEQTWTSLQRHAELTALIGDGKKYPAIPAAATIIPAKPEVDSLGLGGGLGKVTIGTANTSVGARAGIAMTTGNSNTLVGREAGTAMTLADANVAIGHNSMRAQVVGDNNVAVGASALATATANDHVAIGHNALVLATTGFGNVAVGKDAGYNVNGDATKAVTTGGYQTAVGYRAGGSAANSYSTAIGALAAAPGAYASALGSATVASHTGSVAIGRDASGNGATTNANNDFVLGTTAHLVRVPGRLTTAASATTQAGFNVPHGAAPTTPVNGDMWTTTAGVFFRINGVTKTVTLT